MQIMEPDISLHNVMDLSLSRAAITNALDSVENDFIWLNEILTECKNTFSTARVNLLPKTPSQKKQPRRKARRRLTEDLDSISESGTDSQQDAPTSGSDTPVRPLRSTRSRTAQSSTTSSRATRSTRASSKKTEKSENSSSDLAENHGKTAKVKLPSVTESSEQAMASPKSLATVSCSPASRTEEEKSGVRERARAYENMLSERNQGSPVTPKSAGKGTPKSAGKGTPKSAGKGTPKNVSSGTGMEVHSTDVKSSEHTLEPDASTAISTSQNSRRSSQISRRSSVAGRRISLKVLGSKARMRSLQGRLSVTGPCATHANKGAVESQRAMQEKLAAEVESGQDNEAQENIEVNKTKTKPPRTRLRLKKNKSATESSDGNSVNESNSETEKKPSETVSVMEIEETQPEQSSTRTKRKKQMSQSSDDESSKTKTSKDTASSNSEEETGRRTRTKARKVDTVPSMTEEMIQKTESEHQSVEVKTSASSISENQGRTTRTKTRKAQKTTKETPSSEEAMDTDATETSVFGSPSQIKKQQTRSSGRSSGHLSAKSSSTTDSGIGPTTSSAADNIQESTIIKDSTTSVSDPDIICKSGSDSTGTKSEEGSRRETRVISRANIVASEEEDEVRCTRSTRTKTRQEQNKNKDDLAVQAEEQDKEPCRTRTKTIKRKAEEDAADTSASKKSCVAISSDDVQQMDEGDVLDADNDSDYEDIEPDQPAKKIVPSFLNQLRKSSLSRSTSMVSGVVTSFLKKKTPPRRLDFQHLQEQKRKELLQKEKREQERLNRLDIVRKNRAEEQKRRREERMQKVAELREMRQKKELDLKKNLAEKLKERLNSTDRMKEDKFKEEREKQKMRLKRHLEADERRRQEENQRMLKLLEQQEEQKRHEELLQQKKDQEEQERQRRQAEERRLQEERQAEIERQRLAEKERLRQQELEREKERQREKEQKEKAAAQERAERARQELERKKEREQKIQKELEKLKEMEQQRLAKMAAQEENKRKEEAMLHQIIEQHNRKLQNMGFNSTLTLTSSTGVAPSKAASKVQPNPDSYPISPVRQRKNGSLENYDIGDLKSDDSTDDDEAPRKKIPAWAQGANLKAMLINQVYHPPDLDSIFSYIEPPDLNEMFDRKRARFNKRTSSAVWNSPLHKPL